MPPWQRHVLALAFPALYNDLVSCRRQQYKRPQRSSSSLLTIKERERAKICDRNTKKVKRKCVVIQLSFSASFISHILITYWGVKPPAYMELLTYLMMCMIQYDTWDLVQDNLMMELYAFFHKKWSWSCSPFVYRQMRSSNLTTHTHVDM